MLRCLSILDIGGCPWMVASFRWRKAEADEFEAAVAQKTILYAPEGLRGPKRME